jgi:hypothetical protein
MTTKSSISNHPKVEIYSVGHTLEIQITPIKKTVITVTTTTMDIVRMEEEAQATKIMEISMASRLTTRTALQFPLSLHQNKLILKLKNRKRPGTLNYLENLAIRTLQ